MLVPAALGRSGFVGLSWFGLRLVLVLVGPRLRFAWFASGVGFGRCGSFVNLGFGMRSVFVLVIGCERWRRKRDNYNKKNPIREKESN